MENFVVSARKYRPDRFETVVGQPSITTTLKNAIKTKQLAHAYLFCGPRGVGKTTCARIFAKTINCSDLQSDTEACGVCDSCRSFQDNRSFSIHELDAASNNSVDDMRNLIDQVRIPPQVGKYSIYIIDEVHMLSQQAFNSFLKTLEEPPDHAIFILATTEKHKIIPTILSRCQIFDFNRIGVPEITAHLKVVAKKESVDFDEAALNVIAQKADGSMRDALSIFDQVVSFSGKDINYQTVVSHLNVLDHDYYFRLTEAFVSGQYQETLLIFNDILNKGFDAHNFINGLGAHFRNLLVSKDPETADLLEMGGEVAEKYKKVAATSPLAFLYSSLQIIHSSDIHFKQAKDARLHVEICLLKLSALVAVSGHPLLSPASDKPKMDDSDKKPEDQQKEQSPKMETKRADAPTAKETPDKKDTGDDQTDQVQTDQAEEIVSSPGRASISGQASIKSTPKLSDYLNTTDTKTAQTVPAGSEPDEYEILDLNQDNIKTIWNNFAEKIRENQPRLYHTLHTNSPVLTDKRILVHLNNPLQSKVLDDIHHELLGYLKRRTKTEDLDLDKVVEKTENNEKKLFTQEEKYTHLRDQNPALEKFRQNLKLDFD